MSVISLAKGKLLAIIAVLSLFLKIFYDRAAYHKEKAKRASQSARKHKQYAEIAANKANDKKTLADRIRP